MWTNSAVQLVIIGQDYGPTVLPWDGETVGGGTKKVREECEGGQIAGRRLASRPAPPRPASSCSTSHTKRGHVVMCVQTCTAVDENISLHI